jgi:hypothetical protein
VEVLKDKDVVVVYEVPAAHQSAQTRRRMSFPFDKASSPVVGAKSDLPFFVIHRYHKYGPLLLLAPSVCARVRWCVRVRVRCRHTPDACARSLLHNRQRKEDDMGTHIIGKPFPVPSNLTYAQLYTIVWDRYCSSHPVCFL